MRVYNCSMYMCICTYLQQRMKRLEAENILVKSVTLKKKNICVLTRNVSRVYYV